MDLLADFGHIVRLNELLSPFTWLRVGGPVEFFAEPTTVEELTALVGQCRDRDIPIRVLGGGSNVLVRDEGTPGLVIHLSAPAFSDVAVEGRRVTAGGGAKLAHLVSTAVREGLSGLEDLVGIPGTVGGALHGNSGTASVDIGQWTRSATVLTRNGEIITRQRDDLRFAYRSSSLDELVILSAEFELEESDPEKLIKRLQTIWIVKKANQPGSDQAAGYIFKDPLGASAASLIEMAGLKGTRIGEAEVSDRNPNFIVAAPGATAHDIRRLLELMRSRVQERLGVELETHIQIW